MNELAESGEDLTRRKASRKAINYAKSGTGRGIVIDVFWFFLGCDRHESLEDGWCKAVRLDLGLFTTHTQMIRIQRERVQQLAYYWTVQLRALRERTRSSAS